MTDSALSKPTCETADEIERQIRTCPSSFIRDSGVVTPENMEELDAAVESEVANLIKNACPLREHRRAS